MCATTVVVAPSSSLDPKATDGTDASEDDGELAFPLEEEEEAVEEGREAQREEARSFSGEEPPHEHSSMEIEPEEEV